MTVSVERKLRMSDVPQRVSLRDQLSGRWQIPLLVASLALLAAGIWRMRPARKPPTFEQVFEYAVALKEELRNLKRFKAM